MGNTKHLLKVGLISAKKPEQQAFKKYSNEACQPSQEERNWGYYEAEYALDSGTFTQTGYHQEDQVPGAPPMPLTISMHLFSGVEMPRN